MSWRTPAAEELRACAYKLRPMVDAAAGYEGRFNPEDALATLLGGVIQSVIIDEAYLFLFIASPPWYNASLLDLYEVGLYRIAPGSSFGAVTEAMAGIAREQGASRVVVGTSLPKNKEALSRLYQRHGFKVNAIALYKEIT